MSQTIPALNYILLKVISGTGAMFGATGCLFHNLNQELWLEAASLQESYRHNLKLYPHKFAL